MVCVLGCAPVPHLLLLRPPATRRLDFVFVGAGFSGNPNPRAAQLNDDTINFQQGFEDGAELFRRLVHAAGFAGRISVGTAVLLIFELVKPDFLGRVYGLHRFGVSAVVGMCLHGGGAVCFAEFVKAGDLFKHCVYILLYSDEP